MNRPAHAMAAVPTTSASRYLQQLCKHWAHRFPVTFDALRGDVRLAAARVILSAEPEQLKVDLQVDSLDDLPRMKAVLAQHLNRFAFREAPLAFHWERCAAS